jgi:hypothetical protein
MTLHATTCNYMPLDKKLGRSTKERFICLRCSKEVFGKYTKKKKYCFDCIKEKKRETRVTRVKNQP